MFVGNRGAGLSSTASDSLKGMNVWNSAEALHGIRHNEMLADDADAVAKQQILLPPSLGLKWSQLHQRTRPPAVMDPSAASLF